MAQGPLPDDKKHVGVQDLDKKLADEDKKLKDEDKKLKDEDKKRVRTDQDSPSAAGSKIPRKDEKAGEVLPLSLSLSLSLSLWVPQHLLDATQCRHRHGRRSLNPRP